MIGETVRFAGDERHGLRVRPKCCSDSNFFSQLKRERPNMRLPCFEATLASDRRGLTARDHSSRHGLFLRGDRSPRPAGFARETGRRWGRARASRSPDHV
jgi:hypothetical protein